MPEARGQRNGAMKVIVARTPASLELDVFAVELPVRMDLDRAVVGVVSTDDHATAVADHVEALLDSVGRAAGFDDDVHAPTAGETAHRLETRRRRKIEAECGGCAHSLRIVEPGG